MHFLRTLIETMGFMALIIFISFVMAWLAGDINVTTIYNGNDLNISIEGILWGH